MKLNKILKTILVLVFLFSLGMNISFLYHSRTRFIHKNKRHHEKQWTKTPRWLRETNLSQKEMQLCQNRLQKFESDCKIIENQNQELSCQLLQKIMEPEHSEADIQNIKTEILQRQALLQDLTIQFLSEQKHILGSEKQRHILECFMRMSNENHERKNRRRMIHHHEQQKSLPNDTSSHHEQQ